MFSSAPLLITLFLLTATLVPFTSASSSQCFWPDGTGAVDFYPCAPNNEESACCHKGEICTANGYCFGQVVWYFYRGACTDRSWNSNFCNKVCLKGEENNFGQSRNSTYCNLINCDDRDGQWCCAYNGSCCSTESFLPTFGSFLNAVFTATDGSFASTSSTPITTTSGPGTRPATSSPFSSPTSSSSAAPAPSPKSNTSTIVGAAVGAPVGFLALAGLAYLLLRERRRRISAKSAVAKPPVEYAAPPAPPPHRRWSR